MNSAPTSEMRARAFALGFQAVGVADAVPAPHLDAYRAWLDKGYDGTMGYLRRQIPLKEHPAMLLPGCKSVIAVALNYNQEPAREPGQPRIARYALGRDYHKVIRGKLVHLARSIEQEHPGAATRPCVDSAPIFERDYARLAGLGFFGKNTMLIDPKRGSWFFIGLLLTTVRFEPDAPSEGSCGACRKCIDACPTGAIVHQDGRWQLDARKCVSYLTIEHRGPIEPDLQKGIGDWTFGCDICQEVCPFNEPRPSQPLRAQLTQEPDFLRRRDWPSLEGLRATEESRWDALTRGSAVRRAGYQGLKRNAEINLRHGSAGPATPSPARRARRI